jgi:hypothetical protein
MLINRKPHSEKSGVFAYYQYKLIHEIGFDFTVYYHFRVLFPPKKDFTLHQNRVNIKSKCHMGLIRLQILTLTNCFLSIENQS